MKVLSILALCFAAASAQRCPEADGYFTESSQCDEYFQCKDGVPSEYQLCPDGLVFNENLYNSNFPCSYPAEVDCQALGRSGLQQAQPTENCARAWGYFSSGNSAECGYFFSCVDRREFRFTCPEGLAFSSDTYRCDWPDQSPDCDAGAYLGFTCPAERDESQVLSVGIPRYASPRDCRTFFICVGTSPRLQKCDLGLVFNEAVHNCDEPENVPGCQNYYPADELAEIRRVKAARLEAAERRQRAFQERFAELNSNRRN